MLHAHWTVTLGSNTVLPLYRPTDYVECTAVGCPELPENDPAYGC